MDATDPENLADLLKKFEASDKPDSLRHIQFAIGRLASLAFDEDSSEINERTRFSIISLAETAPNIHKIGNNLTLLDMIDVSSRRLDYIDDLFKTVNEPFIVKDTNRYRTGLTNGQGISMTAREDYGSHGKRRITPMLRAVDVNLQLFDNRGQPVVANHEPGLITSMGVARFSIVHEVDDVFTHPYSESMIKLPSFQTVKFAVGRISCNRLLECESLSPNKPIRLRYDKIRLNDIQTDLL